MHPAQIVSVDYFVRNRKEIIGTPFITDLPSFQFLFPNVTNIEDHFQSSVPSS